LDAVFTPSVLAAFALEAVVAEVAPALLAAGVEELELLELPPQAARVSETARIGKARRRVFGVGRMRDSFGKTGG
jgi:hypothetical protein